MNLYFLQQFCSENSSKFKEPFINGDYVVATDAHIMLMIKKEKVDEYETLTESEKDYVQVALDAKGTEYQNIKLKLSDIINAVKSIKIDHDDIHICKDCNGHGNVDFEYTSRNGEWYTLNGDCPVCDGTGVDPNYEYLDIANGWFNKKECAIALKTMWFNPLYIEKLAKVMRECGVNECVLENGSDKKASIFHINDNVTVLIMPIFRGDDIDDIVSIEIEDNKPKLVIS